MNAYYWNNNIQNIFDYIKEVQPERIIMVELSEELFQKIKNEKKFSYSYYHSDGVLSFGFFTNEPILEQKIYEAN